VSGTGVVRAEHFYSQPPSAVWRALTTPEYLVLWWAAGDIRPVVGHRFNLDMGQWGQQPCEILTVEPERLLRFRFAKGSLDTIISWELIPEVGGTRLRLTHEGFNLDSPLGRAALEGMKPGWPKVLGRLESILLSSAMHPETRPDSPYETDSGAR
jgi:uncharacterized protein YndB with AHSA1/START domain